MPPPDALDAVLCYYPDGTELTVRQLLKNIAILGMNGSGKSSSSGLHYARILMGIQKSGGLVLVSKPEDVDFWSTLAAKFNRTQDIILFGPKHKNTCNLQEQLGGDDRMVTDYFLTLDETHNRGSSEGGESGKFWQAMKEMAINYAVIMLRLAYGRCTSTTIMDYISGAAISPAETQDGKWLNGFHNRTNELAFNKPNKTEQDEIDRQQSLRFYLNK